MSSERSLSTVGVPVWANNCVNTGQVKAKESLQEGAGNGVGCREQEHMGKELKFCAGDRWRIFGTKT